MQIAVLTHLDTNNACCQYNVNLDCPVCLDMFANMETKQKQRTLKTKKIKAMETKYTKSEIERMIKNLEEKEKKARSKWDKAVLQDGQRLLENVLEWMEDEEEVEINEKLLLNGAENWKKFSWGGSALIYNGEIAEHYSTPSELKFWGFTKNGGVKRDTNTIGKHLLDIQAKALYQAWQAIRDEMNETFIN